MVLESSFSFFLLFFFFLFYRNPFIKPSLDLGLGGVVESIHAVTMPFIVHPVAHVLIAIRINASSVAALATV